MGRNFLTSWFLEESYLECWLKSIALARITDCATHGEGVIFMKAIMVPRPKKEET